MSAKVQVSTSDVLGLHVALNGIRNGTERVLTKSINAAIKTTQVQAVKKIGADVALTAKRIKGDFTQEKASFKNLKGALIAKGEPVGLINFQARPVKTGVSHKVKRASTRSTTKSAFIQSARGGKHVFRRVRKSSGTGLVGRLPVSRLTGPRIEDIYAKPHIYDAVSKIAADKFAENVSKETKDLLRRYG